MEDRHPAIRAAHWRPSLPDPVDKICYEDIVEAILQNVALRRPGHLPIIHALLQHLAPTMEGANLMSGTALNSLEESLTSKLLTTIGVSHPKNDEDELIPRRTWSEHLQRDASRLLIDVRIAIARCVHERAAELQERLEWYTHMVRTRALDNVLKSLFFEGMETPEGDIFGGKGFRSLWQESIAAAAIALHRSSDGEHTGDRVAPMIRDLGLALAMGDTPVSVIAAQMGKAGSPMDGGIEGAGGRDLHIGCWERGVLPPAAPLPIASATSVGLALAEQRLNEGRFTLACIGEGGSSSGEWWEALNLAAARGLPIAFILQNNQIALDTPTLNQSAVDLWADKAVAVGIPSWTIDGSNPASIYASVAVARDIAMSGCGPSLIHIETMRGCGHAHHHDDLYLGAPSGQPPGYVDRELLAYWEAKDPIDIARTDLSARGVNEEEIEAINAAAEEEIEQARRIVEAMPWPDPESVTRGVFSFTDPPTHKEQFERTGSSTEPESADEEVTSSVQVSFSDARDAWTYSKAIQQAMVAAADRWNDETIFIGEDMEIAGAFGMNLPLVAKHPENLIDAPLSESVIIHSATGAALAGMRPIAEIQFGGFASLAMNSLVNNAAMIRWRWGADVPLTVRIPIGARTSSGPFHAKPIEAWLSNDPGLVVLAPSMPQDAYDLLLDAVALPDPCVFLEHIGLYGLRGGRTGWGDCISQNVDTKGIHNDLDKGLGPHRIGTARTVRTGGDLTIITWSAMVHVALRAAEQLAAEHGIGVEVIDLRTLIPWDEEMCIDSVSRTGRLMVLQEAQWTGGFAHTIASRVLESTFWNLETQPIVLGSLDTPVPFSPPLERHTVPSKELIIEHVVRMMA